MKRILHYWGMKGFLSSYFFILISRWHLKAARIYCGFLGEQDRSFALYIAQIQSFTPQCKLHNFFISINLDNESKLKSFLLNNAFRLHVLGRILQVGMSDKSVFPEIYLENLDVEISKCLYEHRSDMRHSTGSSLYPHLTKIST